MPYTSAGYLSGALTLYSNVRLRFAKGAKFIAPSSLATSWISCSADAHVGTVVEGGIFDATAVTSTSCLAVIDYAPDNVTIENNDVSQSGTPLTIQNFVQANQSTWRVRANKGYNPLGDETAQFPTPTALGSGNAQTNSLGTDCIVYVSGGTVSAIAVGGKTTGLTSGAFYVPAGSTITLTWTVTPAWVWIAQ